MKRLTIDEIEVGQKAAKQIMITEEMLFLWCGLTGDMNPIHLDAEYASKTKFGKRIAPGLLSSSLMASLLGTDLPGASSVYVSQEFKFKAPVFIGDLLRAEVEVIEKNIERNRITLRTTCINQNGQLVIDGLGVTMPAKPNS